MVTGQVSPAPVNTPGTSQADLVSTGLADTPPAIPSEQDGDLAPAANLAKRPDAARQDPVALSNESQPAAFALAEGVATVTRQNIPTPVIAPRTPMTEVAPAMPAAQDDDLAPAVPDEAGHTALLAAFPPPTGPASDHPPPPG